MPVTQGHVWLLERDRCYVVRSRISTPKMPLISPAKHSLFTLWLSCLFFRSTAVTFKNAINTYFTHTLSHTSSLFKSGKNRRTLQW